MAKKAFEESDTSQNIFILKFLRALCDELYCLPIRLMLQWTQDLDLESI